jgi:glyoxylase-like metal-dependent hydrolase (beta-lactamase superfamily II)
MRQFIILFILFSITHATFSQSQFDNVEIKSTKLTDQIYMLEGAGGNIGLIIGDDGTLIIDDQYAPLSAKIKAAIAGLSDKKVNYVMNTHWHGDHTGGNESFGKDGATIIAQQNVRNRMSQEAIRGDQVTPASPDIALPVITFGEDLQLYFNNQEIMAIHVHNGHTDGDALIWIPRSNVLHMGDCFFHNRYPYIDQSSGGSVNGVIKAVEAALLLVDDNTQIIPGHGPMATKADLTNYLQFLKNIRIRTMAQITAGTALDDIDADAIVQSYEDWAWGFIDAKRLVTIFYNSLTTP